MSGEIRSRGNKNSRMHVRRRRVLIAQIVREMQRNGEVPINKEAVLERLEFFGYGTSMRNLERDIATIFTSDISAVLPNRSYKIEPGARYMKILEDEYRDTFYAPFFQMSTRRRAALEKRGKRLQGIQKMLDLVQRKADDLSESLPKDKTDKK